MRNLPGVYSRGPERVVRPQFPFVDPDRRVRCGRRCARLPTHHAARSPIDEHVLAAQIPAEPPRAGPHHRRGRRRPERHRHLFAGRRAVRLRDAVERVPHHAADGGHPGGVGAHRPRHRPRSRREPARILSAAAAGVRGVAAARGQHDQHRRRHRRDGRSAAARGRRPGARPRAPVRRAGRADAALPALFAAGAGAAVADAVAVRLRAGAVHDQRRLAAAAQGHAAAAARTSAATT